MEYIKEGLRFFVDHYNLWGITSIAFPRLGSSHGGLNWTEVREILYDYLANLDLTVELYEFDSTYQDKLFISLMNTLKEMTLHEYTDKIGLKLREARLLKESVDKNSIRVFADIQGLPGFGEKSISNVYSFANSKPRSIQKRLI